MNKFAVGFVGARGQHTVFHGESENVDMKMKPYLAEQHQTRLEGSYLYTLTKRYFEIEESMMAHVQTLKNTYSGISDGGQDISSKLNMVEV